METSWALHVGDVQVSLGNSLQYWDSVVTLTDINSVVTLTLN